MPGRRLHRIVVLGTGTGVGKTRVTRALAQALRRTSPAVALKPLGGDADARDFDADNPIVVRPHPLISLKEPLSPHLAAQREGRRIQIEDLVAWVRTQESCVALCDNSSPYFFSLIETAGGALTPLSREARNLELARVLEPDTLLLVGPDSLGVLHALSSTLIAMATLGCSPDLVALSAARNDASTGTNAAELRELGIVDPVLVLGRDDDDASPLAEAILRRVSS